MINEISKLGLIGIVPVIAIDDAEDAGPLAKALCGGGLPCAEVTFRTEAAEKSIRTMNELFPDMLVGAGTVLTTEQADKAIAAGAKFIVSPGLNKRVVAHCIEKGITVIPGCASPSDLEAALELGLHTVKIFPAEAVGGLGMIKAMSAPYTAMTFLPTGGINVYNLNDYLSFKKVVACGGSWMVSRELIAAGRFDEIAKLTGEAVKEMLGFEIAHVGINEVDENNADATATQFAKIFGFEKKITPNSVFAGTAVEVMKTLYLGKNGHIAISTNYIERAVYHLERRGVRFDKSTQRKDCSGALKSVYLENEVGGFAVHLVQK